MKGKQYTPEDKIRILREADGGKAIQDVCREQNIFPVSFHRWKRQFGQMDVNEVRRLKELERENSELKKMLAEALLKNRVLEAVCEKNSKPRAATRSSAEGGSRWDLLWASGLSDSAIGAVNLLISWAASFLGTGATPEAAAGVVGGASALWVSADCRAVAAGRLACWETTCATTSSSGGAPRASDQAQGGATRHLDGLAGEGDASWAYLDVGLHRRRYGTRGCVTDADDSG